jgi:tripartite-type tricarboxylate transporter receptor subunit TctC
MTDLLCAAGAGASIASRLARAAGALAVALGALSSSVPGEALAQAWPARPVRLVVPYPPGGGTDFFARAVSAKMGEELGQQVVVENRPGASTIIGADLVAKSPADGYTVLLGDTATYAANPSLFKSLPYDPVRDLAPVTLTARFALILVTSLNVPWTTVPEFIAAAKAAPGSIDYASPGAGSPHHLAMELFRQSAGITLTHVPYKGGGPAAQDLLAGRIPVMFLDLTTMAPQLKAGKIKALAVSTDKRIAAFPDLPAVAEVGVPGYDASAWQGLSVPAGTPAAVIARLNAAFAKAAADEPTRQRLADLGTEFVNGTPEQMAAFIRSETAKWSRTIRTANITLD